MRDAQSLLDQLLAFAEEGRLTLDQVHRLLGTANDDRIVALASAVLDHDAAKAVELFGQAADEGLQLGEVLDQLIDYWRDLMIVSCAGADGRELSVSNRHRPTLSKQAQALSVEMILAGLDVLATTKARLRGSSHGRILIEMALVRLARLENLISVAQLTQNARSAPTKPQGESASPAGRAPEPAAPRPPVTRVEPAEKKNAAADAEAALTLTEATLPQIWTQVLGQVGQIYASYLVKGTVAIGGPSHLVVRFSAAYNDDRDYCQEPARVDRVVEALRKITGRAWQVRFDLIPGEPAAAPPAQPAAEATPTRYVRQRAEALQEPLLKRALEQLGAQVVYVDDGFGAAPAESSERNPASEPEEA
jgi:DNA polymerase-3 subunit gamma/tau